MKSTKEHSHNTYIKIILKIQKSYRINYYYYYNADELLIVLLIVVWSNSLEDC